MRQLISRPRHNCDLAWNFTEGQLERAIEPARRFECRRSFGGGGRIGSRDIVADHLLRYAQSFAVKCDRVHERSFARDLTER